MLLMVPLSVAVLVASRILMLMLMHPSPSVQRRINIHIRLSKIRMRPNKTSIIGRTMHILHKRSCGRGAVFVVVFAMACKSRRVLVGIHGGEG